MAMSELWRLNFGKGGAAVPSNIQTLLNIKYLISWSLLWNKNSQQSVSNQAMQQLIAITEIY